MANMTDFYANRNIWQLTFVEWGVAPVGVIQLARYILRYFKFSGFHFRLFFICRKKWIRVISQLDSQNIF